jgi:hypothetical protein
MHNGQVNYAANSATGFHAFAFNAERLEDARIQGDGQQITR